MSDNFWKVPEVTKSLNLPVDSAIGLRVKIPIGDVLGLYWTGYWTVLNTALGQFELKCEETSLCPWKFLAEVETKFTGEGQTPELILKNEVQFSQRMKQWKSDPVEQGRKYNKVEFKLTRKSAIGIRQDAYVNFDVENNLLDVMICNKEKTQKVYANSGVLALNSPVLRKQLEGEEKVIIVESNLFPAVRKLLNFIHPPFLIEKENIGKVLELVQKWEMSQVLVKYEDFLIKHRSYSQDASVKNIKLAEKFKMRNLLEEVLWNDTSCVYKLLEDNCFSTWTRAAMFEFILEMEDQNIVANEDDDNDSNSDDDDDDDGPGLFWGSDEDF